MSAMMRRLKPWAKSTGPKTDEGKQRASQNGSLPKARRETPQESAQPGPAEQPPSELQAYRQFLSTVRGG